jgi:hypothetical protein
MATGRKTIRTRNVNQGLGGTRVSAETYEAVRKAILAALPRNRQGILFKDLPREVVRRADKSLFPREGSASWYTTVVKLDLEARGLIERVLNAVPQRLRRVK